MIYVKWLAHNSGFYYSEQGMPVVKVPYECAPLWTLSRFLLLIIHRIVPILQVLATATFIDRALLFLGGEASFGDLVFPIVALTVLLAITRVYDAICSFVNCKIDNAMRINFKAAIVEKRAALLYTYVEDTKTWDLVSRVSGAPEQNFLQGMSSVIGIIGIIIVSIGLLSILIAHVWWAAIIILIISIPMVRIAIKSGTAQYQVNIELSKTTRKYEYFSSLLSGRESVNERTLFGFYNYLTPQWAKLYNDARKKFMQVEIQWAKKSKIGGTIMSLFVILIAFAILQPVATGVITVGMYVALIQASTEMVQIMAGELPGSIIQYTKFMEYCKDISTFVNLNDNEEYLDLPDDTAMDFQTLEFRDVSFEYPGTHDELMKLGGVYCEMYESQRSWYQ